jgi:hypothetical protein
LSDPGEVVRFVNEGFLPIIREIPGFVDYYFIDGGDGVLVSTSIFERASGEEESNWTVRGAASNSLVSKPAPQHSR